MATDDEIYAVYNRPDLFHKVLVENLKQANTIANEDPGTPNHVNRLTWAKFIFASPEAAATKMRIAVISNGDIQNGDTQDATVGYVVAVMTDFIANL
jgi:hypothetical protein